MKIWSFDTMLKLTKDQPHNSQESPTYKHLSQKEREAKAMEARIPRSRDETFLMRKRDISIIKSELNKLQRDQPL